MQDLFGENYMKDALDKWDTEGLKDTIKSCSSPHEFTMDLYDSL